MSEHCLSLTRAALFVCGFALAANASAAPLEPVQSLAGKEKAPLLATLKDLVSIESGSGDREGLDKIAALIAERLRTVGGGTPEREPVRAVVVVVDRHELSLAAREEGGLAVTGPLGGLG